MARRAGRCVSSGESGFPQRGGASVGDAHPAKNERRFPPPSARGLPARRACRQAGRQAARLWVKSLASVAAFFAAAKAARAPLSKQTSRSHFLKPLAFVRAARVVAG